MPKVWNKRDPNCPKDAVYVGRPSKWGNPYKIGQLYDGIRLNRQHCINLYESWLLESVPTPIKDKMLAELKGKDLVCWCSPEPCHADVLLELANKE
jgi:hypothetical protein